MGGGRVVAQLVVVGGVIAIHRRGTYEIRSGEWGAVRLGDLARGGKVLSRIYGKENTHTFGLMGEFNTGMMG